MNFTVAPLSLPLTPHAPTGQSLYPHQLEMWDQWDRADTLLLAAKTGTGKTRAALLPILKRNEWAVAIYPTNELVRDQVRAVAELASLIGGRPLVWTPDLWSSNNRQELYSGATHILAPIDGAILDQWQRTMRCKSRGEALRRLLDPDKPKVIFTNPDILFLILGLRYHAEPFEALRHYSTLIADEFHLYTGVELAHALAMIAMARAFAFFRRTVLLTATPHPEVAALLHRAVQPTYISGTPTGREPSWSTAVHAVRVVPIPVGTIDPVDRIVPHLLELKPELDQLRAGSENNDYIPAVVVVNSVFTAIRLEDRLVEEGFDRDSLAIIRGLSNRAIREKKRSLLAIGTSAIEVGVDFDSDFLVFEASDASSFLQRFGRIGRHRPGKAFPLVPPNALAGMRDLPATIDRASFEQRIYSWYPSVAVRPWFVMTESGMLSARTMAENFVRTVQSDTDAPQELISRIRTKVESALSNLAKALGCEEQNFRARTGFDRAAAGKAGWRWLEAYRRLNRFRTSLPSVPVHDFMEQSRRVDWRLGSYEADLASLLRRGREVRWNEKLGMVTIRGIGAYCRVHAGDLFSDDDCGVVLETRDFPTLLLYQDGQATPASDLLARENHIFTVVPRRRVEGELDWRLQVFESGKYVIAFDGAALLLLELWTRTSGKTSLTGQTQ